MRIQVSIPESDLATIDEAAEAAGESRSEYLRNAALARAGGETASESRMREIAREEITQDRVRRTLGPG